MTINLRGRRDIPYCYVKLDSGKWLPLDRGYNPLGKQTSYGDDYNQFDQMAVSFDCDPMSLHDGFDSPSNSNDRFYLYSDDPRTHKTYWSRLKHLESHIVG